MKLNKYQLDQIEVDLFSKMSSIKRPISMELACWAYVIRVRQKQETPHYRVGKQQILIK